MQDTITSYREIPLTRGKVALVDAEDYENVVRLKWQAQLSKGTWYAARGATSRRSHLSMHRLIMNAPPAMQVDHINGNGLDNRRCNLRLATVGQNDCNRPRTKRNTSGYKGVSLKKPFLTGRLRWFARISHNGKDIGLGYHDTAEEAARVYDAKAVELFGDFAYLNFPEEGRQQHG